MLSRTTCHPGLFISEDDFRWHRTLVGTHFSPSPSRTHVDCLLTCVTSVKNSAILLFGKQPGFFPWLLWNFSLCLWFCRRLSLMCMDVAFVFILLGICWTSHICGLLYRIPGMLTVMSSFDRSAKTRDCYLLEYRFWLILFLHSYWTTLCACSLYFDELCWSSFTVTEPLMLYQFCYLYLLSSLNHFLLLFYSSFIKVFFTLIDQFQVSTSMSLGSKCTHSWMHNHGHTSIVLTTPRSSLRPLTAPGIYQLALCHCFVYFFLPFLEIIGVLRPSTFKAITDVVGLTWAIFVTVFYSLYLFFISVFSSTFFAFSGVKWSFYDFIFSLLLVYYLYIFYKKKFSCLSIYSMNFQRI